jgi:hypothetical protein
MSNALASTRMTVVVAAVDARATVVASVDRFRDEIRGRGELIVVDASRDGTADLVEGSFPEVRVLRSTPGRLVPELWRDGLEATASPLVAFSTAQMVPAVGWHRAMLGRMEETGAAVVGGPIEPGPDLTPPDMAIYLLRYVTYLRPFPVASGPRQVEPPGENAVYRRECLDGLDRLWDRGFWEAEIHRALRARDERLSLAEGAAVEFRGGTVLRSMVLQRLRHSRRYGAGRARELGTAGRLARVIASPVIPALLLARIGAALSTRGRSLVPWWRAFPCLIPLLAAWTLGEAQGMGAGLIHRRRPRELGSVRYT